MGAEQLEATVYDMRLDRGLRGHAGDVDQAFVTDQRVVDGEVVPHRTGLGEDVGRWAASAVTLFTPEALRAAVDNVRAAGGDELFFVPTTADPDELARTRDALGI